MHKLSLKMKLTLWYTFFMMILFVLAFSFLYYLSADTTQTTVKKQLRNIVNEALLKIEYNNNGLEFDNDIGFYSEGVNLIAYKGDNKEKILYGYVPELVQRDYELKLDSFQSKILGEETWYIYDNAIIVEDYGKVWIRGAMSFSEAQIAMRDMLRWFGIIFPGILLVTAMFGYLIVKRTFSPMNQMIHVANNIGKGKDLTKRIGLVGTSDEIHQLSCIFDEMFARLQKYFENEEQFIFDASHELRTPISVIISQCEYLLEKSEIGMEGEKEISVILKQAQKMSRLISQLLMLSKSEYQIQKEEFDISELTETVIEEQQIFADKKQILIQADIEPNIMMIGDETLLIRLLMNLISNSISYGRENGNIYIKLIKRSGKLYGEICDDGIGIQEEHISKIWNRFYQVDTARGSHKDRGNGLGLSMVKWIIEKHGGDIQIKSKYGKGTTINFFIPLIFS